MVIRFNGKVGFRTKQFFGKEAAQEKSTKRIGSNFYLFYPSKSQQNWFKIHNMDRIQKSTFLHTTDGCEITLYTLTNSSQITVGILDLGGTIVSLRTPDRAGQLEDVVLTYHDPAQYLTNPMYFGSLIGRVANRIADASFLLDDKRYNLSKNDGPNNLHSGPDGFHLRLWQAETSNAEDSASVHLSLHSPEGDQGYPGEVAVWVRYSLDDLNRLSIQYRAQTTANTPLSLTNHAYFNLGGQACADILHHTLWIDADHFTAVNDNLIPLHHQPVAETPFDFREPKSIAPSIFQEDLQLKRGNGFDHNWVLNHPMSFSKAAVLSEPISGRQMTVWTDMPGVQFYAGGAINTTIPGRSGSPYPKYGGLCLETQFPPDAVNRPDFTSPILCPGQTYQHETIFEFSVSD